MLSRTNTEQMCHFSAFQLANLLWSHVVISMFLVAEMPAKTIVVLVTVFKPRLLSCTHWLRWTAELCWPFQEFQEINCTFTTSVHECAHVLESLHVQKCISDGGNILQICKLSWWQFMLCSGHLCHSDELMRLNTHGSSLIRSLLGEKLGKQMHFSP